MGDCPFWKKPCEKVKDCHIRRKGLRYFGDHRKPEPFDECSILLAVDLLENLTTRLIGVQKATEGSRNEVSKVNDFFEELKEMRILKALEDKHGR